MEDGHVSSYKSSMGLSENGVKLFFLLDHHSSNQQMAICTGYTPFSDTQMIRTGHFQRRGHRVRSCHGHRPPIVAEAAPVEGAANYPGVVGYPKKVEFQEASRVYSGAQRGRSDERCQSETKPFKTRPGSIP